MSNPSISLLVATYNWPAALDLCLNSIRSQTMLPAEVIIADDGSGKDTENLIKKHQKDFPVPLIHIWHTDDGFQLSRIRNKAIAQSKGSYIIQIDGDLILERHFIADHFKFSLHGTFVSGTRVQLPDELSKKLLAQQKTNFSLFSKGIINLSNAVRISLLRNFLASRYKAKNIIYVRGCNMAFWKKDLIKVNGYNERIIGWGREDSELAVRLVNSGIKKRILKFGAVTYHIYHPEATRQSLAANDNILQESICNRIQTCEYGLSNYL